MTTIGSSLCFIILSLRRCSFILIIEIDNLQIVFTLAPLQCGVPNDRHPTIPCINNNNNFIIHRFNSSIMNLMTQQRAELIRSADSNPIRMPGLSCIVRLYLAGYYGQKRYDNFFFCFFVFVVVVVGLIRFRLYFFLFLIHIRYNGSLLLCVWLLHFYISAFVLLFLSLVVGWLLSEMCRHRRAFFVYLLFIIMIFSGQKIYSFIFKWFDFVCNSCFLFFSFSLVLISFWKDRESDSIAWTKRMCSKHIILDRTQLRQCNVFQHFLNSIVLHRASVRLYACMLNSAAFIFSDFRLSLAFEFIYFQIVSSSLFILFFFCSGAATTLTVLLHVSCSFIPFDWIRWDVIYLHLHFFFFFGCRLSPEAQKEFVKLLTVQKESQRDLRTILDKRPEMIAALLGNGRDVAVTMPGVNTVISSNNYVVSRMSPSIFSNNNLFNFNWRSFF